MKKNPRQKGEENPQKNELEIKIWETRSVT